MRTRALWGIQILVYESVFSAFKISFSVKVSNLMKTLDFPRVTLIRWYRHSLENIKFSFEDTFKTLLLINILGG